MSSLLCRHPSVSWSHLHHDVSGASTDSDTYFEKRDRRECTRQWDSWRKRKPTQSVTRHHNDSPVANAAGKLEGRPRHFRLNIPLRSPCESPAPHCADESAATRARLFRDEQTSDAELWRSQSIADVAREDARGQTKPVRRSCSFATSESSVGAPPPYPKHGNRATIKTGGLGSLKYALKVGRPTYSQLRLTLLPLLHLLPLLPLLPLLLLLLTAVTYSWVAATYTSFLQPFL